MPPQLRPRHQGPPSDHSYSHIPGTPVYDQRCGPIVISGPNRPRNILPVVEPPKTDEQPKRKRHWYFGERRTKRRRKRSTVGPAEDAPPLKRVATVPQVPYNTNTAWASTPSSDGTGPHLPDVDQHISPSCESNQDEVIKTSGESVSATTSNAGAGDGVTGSNRVNVTLATNVVWMTKTVYTTSLSPVTALIPVIVNPVSLQHGVYVLNNSSSSTAPSHTVTSNSTYSPNVVYARQLPALPVITNVLGIRSETPAGSGDEQSSTNTSSSSSARPVTIQPILLSGNILCSERTAPVSSTGGSLSEHSSVSEEHKSPCERCGKGWRHCLRGHSRHSETRHSSRLVRKNYKLPFDELPLVVKLHIFSLLDPKERCAIATVCSEWAELIRDPSLWSTIDFNMFNPVIRRLKHGPQAKVLLLRWFASCGKYNEYVNRVGKFVEFLHMIRPCLRQLHFSFDLLSSTDCALTAHPRENWLGYILDVLHYAQTKELTHVDIDWSHTPVRPPCADKFCCLFNKARIKFRHHFYRIPRFHTFFNALTKCSPNITYLSMPFDWSERSVLYLCRLRSLQTLKLSQYIGPGPFTQELLDAILRSLPELVHLELHVFIATFRRQKFYTLSHKSLQHVDISSSNRLFLKQVNLPQLRTFVVDRPPYPIPQVATNDHIPCLYGVLRSGCKQLTYINKFRLQPYWLEFMYEELDKELERACSCKDHALNWNQQVPQQQ